MYISWLLCTSKIHSRHSIIQWYPYSVSSTDRVGLANQRVVERIQDKLIEALKLQISRNHSTEPALYSAILMKIPELRTVGNRHFQQVCWFRERFAQMRLPPLFSEIFDIPKTEEDLLSSQQQQMAVVWAVCHLIGYCSALADICLAGSFELGRSYWLLLEMGWSDWFVIEIGGCVDELIFEIIMVQSGFDV